MASELYDVRSIKTIYKEGLGKKFGFYLKAGWFFEHWYEKLILTVLGALGMWKIIEFF